MALIDCNECKKQVSDKASACPNCGAPISNKSDIAAIGTNLTTTQLTSKRLKLHMLLSGILTLIGIFILYRHSGGGLGYTPLQITPFVVGIIWFAVARIRAWWHHG